MEALLWRAARKFGRRTFLGLMLLIAQAAFADNSKISPDLLPLLSNPANKVNVIVQYNTAPTQQQTCSTGGGLLGLVGGVVCTVVNLAGGVLFGLINAVAGTLQVGDVITLSNQSNVTYISLDRSVNATLDYTADAVNAPIAWNSGLDGTGIGIAVIDSGIYPHPDLNSAWGGSRVVYRKSFIGGVQYDDYGHGTHVAGIAAGQWKLVVHAGIFAPAAGHRSERQSSRSPRAGRQRRLAPTAS